MQLTSRALALGVIFSLGILGNPSFVKAEGGSSAEQSGMSAPEEGTSQQSPSMGMSESDIKGEAARITLAPHSIAVETALMSALDQIRGLKAQVKTAQSQPSSDFMVQYRWHSKEIKDAVKSARTHQMDLNSRAGKFPSVARAEEYQRLSPAISDVERLNQQWEKQASTSHYWRNPTKVTADLDQLERRLNNALDKAKSFNSRFEISSVG